MKTKNRLLIFSLFVAGFCHSAEPGKAATDTTAYHLCANDLVELKVYQEDDLETKFRLAKDGTATLPLIGTIHLGGQTLQQAAATIRDELAKDYYVNPQVTSNLIDTPNAVSWSSVRSRSLGPTKSRTKNR